MTKLKLFRRRFAGYAAALVMLMAVQPWASVQALSIDLAGVSHRQFSLSDSPLFLGNTPPANVLLMFDDSISMSSDFALTHRDGSGDIDKLGADGTRQGSKDQAQGMARAADNAGLYYPWLYPMPAQMPTDLPAAACTNLVVPVIPTDLPDENGSALCSQVAPSYELVEAWNSDTAVRGANAAIDSTADLQDAWQLRSAQFNPLYYDPERTYSPWPGVDQNGNAFVDASFTAIKLDPWSATSATLNLSTPVEFVSAVVLADGSFANIAHQDYGATGGPDLRYVIPRYYSLVESGLQTHTILAADADATNFANWFQYYRTRGHVARGVLAELIAELEDVRVALASIHHDDANAQPMVAIAGAADSGNKRLLLDKLYQIKTLAAGSPLRGAVWNAAEYYRCDAVPTRFQDYYTTTEQTQTENIVGDNSCPILAEAEGGACQPNHLVLATDGYSTVHARELVHTGFPVGTGAAGATVLNHNDPQGAVVTSNDDGDNNSAFDGGFYGDAEFDTAADAAMGAFEADLVATLAGDQRMNTHVLLMSAEAGAGSLANILAGGESWPVVFFAGSGVPGGQPPPTDAEAFEYANLITEMRHAALNGRGRFLSGLSTGAISEFEAVFARVAGRELSGTNAAASAASLGDDTLVFLTSYDVEDYSGDLQAFRITSEGDFDLAWSAADSLTSESGRVILTYDPRRSGSVGTGYGSGGVPFTVAGLEDTSFFGGIPLFGNVIDDTLTALSDIIGLGFLDDIPLIGGLVGAVTGQINALLGGVLSGLGAFELLESIGLTGPLTTDTINYIRGERTNEQQNGGTLRDRGDSVMGPIFSSDPVFVGAPLFDYPDGFEVGSGDQQYHEFAEQYANRTPMVYVGANDGMLHGFNAETGEELVAFVPSRILSGLRDYPDPAFAPRAYVDGQVSVVDVFGKYPACGGGSECWRTILVGTLGRGGQGLFALDITDPSTFSETNAEDIVLWEFTDKGSLLGETRTLVVNLIQDTLCDALGTGGNSLCDIVIPLLLFSIDVGAIVEGLLATIVDDLLDLLIDSEERGDPDLGYTLVQANIVHTGAEFSTNTGGNNDGDWAVIVANGYNNTEIDLGLLDVDTNLATSAPLSFSITGNAGAFAIDLETGILVKHFDTGVGAFIDLGNVLDGDPATTITLPDLTDESSSLLSTLNLPVSLPNGMATTAVVDIDADRTVDYFYGGDLTGSLWRADLTGTVNEWELYSPGLDAEPIFQATNFAGVPQPITVEPMVKLHPLAPREEGVLLLFGTGEYLESDSADEVQFTQSFYGVWDELTGTVGSGSPNLLKRYIEDTVTTTLDTSLDGSSEQVTLRLVSGDSHDGDGDGGDDGPINWAVHHGWHLDFIDGANDSAQSANAPNGERVIANPVLRNDRILFSSIVPLGGVCAPSLENWLFQLDADDGSPEVFAPFDLNGDGGLTSADLYDNNGTLVAPGARSSEGAYAPIPTILINDLGQEIHISPTAEGGVERVLANPIGYERSRSTWRQLR